MKAVWQKTDDQYELMKLIRNLMNSRVRIEETNYSDEPEFSSLFEVDGYLSWYSEEKGILRVSGSGRGHFNVKLIKKVIFHDAQRITENTPKYQFTFVLDKQLDN